LNPINCMNSSKLLLCSVIVTCVTACLFQYRNLFLAALQP
jgi:hypothetical protein